MPENALIVDNDFFFVKFLGGLLKERGFNVFQAYDGKQGIAVLENQVVHYVFVDIIMPRIDGRQFIDFVREKYPDAEFSIIGMSDSIVELRELQKEVGADYYLQKQPIEKMPEYADSWSLLKAPLFSLRRIETCLIRKWSFVGRRRLICWSP